jgi:hypothetical protein
MSRKQGRLGEAFKSAQKPQGYRAAAWIAGVIALCAIIWSLSQALDRRIKVDVIGLNIWSTEIRESRAKVSESENRWVGWGYLKYDTDASYSDIYITPPGVVRVYWTSASGEFDRTVPVEGMPEKKSDHTLAIPLLIEIDSRCGRARASWKRDMNEIWIVRPRPPIEQNCEAYKDQKTPEGSGPLPSW